MPEIAWSQLRRRFTPRFETLLEEGVTSGLYDPDNMLQLMVFRWVFIPWLQRELDQYKDRINNSWKRRNRNKILPHGIPELIHHCAEDYGALDFKVMVTQEAIEHIHQVYIMPDHVVFNLIPPALNTFIQGYYVQLGLPSVQRRTVWTIYADLLSILQNCNDIAPWVAAESHDEVPDTLPLMDGLRDLPQNNYYMGGIGNGLGLQEVHICALHKLDFDLPDVAKDDDNIDAGPSLWVDGFSDNEEEEIDASL